MAAPMVEVRRHILSVVAEVDGEVVHVVDGASKRVYVVIRGVGVMWLLLLLRSSSLFFYFIILFWHFNVWLILFTAHDGPEVQRLSRGAGIHAVVSKSNAVTHLIAQAEALVAQSGRAHIA